MIITLLPIDDDDNDDLVFNFGAILNKDYH